MMFGPLLRFNNIQSFKTWTGSVLVGLDESITSPTVRLKGVTYHGEKLMTALSGVTFWRFMVSVPMEKWQVSHSYSVRDKEKVLCVHSFFVPGLKDNWNIAFFSCNGFEKEKDMEKHDISQAWANMVQKHQRAPLNLMIGGGDQGYFDGVFEIGCVSEALSKYKTLNLVTEDVKHAIEKYYVEKYMKHFSNAGFSLALASIPYMFMWDDHDIFDGYGSYDVDFLQSPIVRTVYRIARKYYLLFQQHCVETETDMTKQGLTITYPAPLDLSTREAHIVKVVGPNLVVAAMDNRSARTLQQVTSIQGINTFFKQLQKVFNADKGKYDHLLVVLPIPIGAYPPVGNAEGILKFVNPICKLLSVNDGYSGDVDILDDVIDHWDSSNHRLEREEMLVRLSQFAEEHKVRITIISGDVHCGGFGAINGWTPQGFVVPTSTKSMMQIISSPIGNHPAPSALVSMYNMGRFPKKQGSDNCLGVVLNNGVSHGLIAKRNWCEMTIDKHSAMHATLHVENKETWTNFTVTIPPIQTYNPDRVMKT